MIRSLSMDRHLQYSRSVFSWAASPLQPKVANLYGADSRAVSGYADKDRWETLLYEQRPAQQAFDVIPCGISQHDLLRLSFHKKSLIFEA